MSEGQDSQLHETVIELQKDRDVRLRHRTQKIMMLVEEKPDWEQKKKGWLPLRSRDLDPLWLQHHNGGDHRPFRKRGWALLEPAKGHQGLNPIP